MTVKLHNTLTKKVDIFTPIEPKKVKLYTCGPTVYNYLHIGNWAAYIYWDTLVRMLRYADFEVERVMNITDVGHLVSDADDGEDKMEKGARREGKTAWAVAEHYTADFLAGMKTLNLIEPEHIVKATDFIEQQLELVRVLKNKGFTYQINDGIYFDTSKFPRYADFAELDINAQQAGARVVYNTDKRNHSDFAVWKFTPNNEVRDMEWETPQDLLELAGGGVGGAVMGFPGWHLECSAMATAILGDTIDIHTGGIDHIPVHHTNEIAQSEAASGKQFANYWLHNNHLRSEGKKISKSLNNGFTLTDIAGKGYSAMDYRMFVLQSQFQTESNFSWENLTAAKNRLNNWHSYAVLRHQTHDTLKNDTTKNIDSNSSLLAANRALYEALSNNLNTPEVLQLVDEAFSKLDKLDLDEIHQNSLKQLLETIDDLLGLNIVQSTPDITDNHKKIIIDRNRARDNKDWAKSDELRDQLIAQGILLRDTQSGAIWSYIN